MKDINQVWMLREHAIKCTILVHENNTLTMWGPTYVRNYVPDEQQAEILTLNHGKHNNATATMYIHT